MWLDLELFMTLVFRRILSGFRMCREIQDFVTPRLVQAPT